MKFSTTGTSLLFHNIQPQDITFWNRFKEATKEWEKLVEASTELFFEAVFRTHYRFSIKGRTFCYSTQPKLYSTKAIVFSIALVRQSLTNAFTILPLVWLPHTQRFWKCRGNRGPRLSDQKLPDQKVMQVVDDKEEERVVDKEIIRQNTATIFQVE